MVKRRYGSQSRTLFAKNLRSARLAKRFTQEELADRAGLHATYVGAVERGERNVTIDTMDRLSRALGVRLRDLLSED